MSCTKAGDYNNIFEALNCCMKYHTEEKLYYCDVPSTVLATLIIVGITSVLCIICMCIIGILIAIIQIYCGISQEESTHKPPKYEQTNLSRYNQTNTCNHRIHSVIEMPTIVEDHVKSQYEIEKDDAYKRYGHSAEEYAIEKNNITLRHANDCNIM